MISLRSATAEDLDAICAIDQKSFAQPWARASFETALADAERSIFLVAQNEAVCGFGLAWNVGDEGEVATIAVDESARGQGVGETLMRALLEELQARAVTAVFLEVRPSNCAAQRLYRRLGFAVVGERRNYYANGESALVMKNEL
ncbi:MAG TPA: ribosomal protein S18-alanine N-acetyltransferase [Abditibacteriaceae bacterium]|jgi:ribosomal-protein-alanine N-acetyltransferase